jgi:transposase
MDAPEAGGAGAATPAGANRTLAHRAMATVKKGAVRKRQMPVFVDEAGAYLLPSTIRTYAPCGLTPEIEVYETFDHLGIMGAITPAGHLFSLMRSRSMDGWDSVWFLRHLHRQLGCRLLVIWDGASIHRTTPLKRFLAEGGSQFIQLERLPAYAPELNPQEGAWHLLKDVELANVCCRNLGHLADQLHLAVVRLRRAPDLILSCFEQAGLKL